MLFYVHYLCKYDVVGGKAPFFLACMKPKSNISDTVRAPNAGACLCAILAGQWGGVFFTETYFVYICEL